MEEIFQLLDVDYILVNNLPVVRLFGKTKEGKIICAFYEGFLPYFYVLPKDEKKVAELMKKKYSQSLSKLEEVERYLPIGFSEKKTKLLKIVLKNPAQVPEIREELRGSGFVEAIYEADILFKYRFMADFGLYGMKWVKVEGNPVKTITVKCPAISCTSIRPTDAIENAPLKYLSFDIECIPSEGLPNPKKIRLF